MKLKTISKTSAPDLGRAPLPGKRSMIHGLPMSFNVIEWYDRSRRLWLVTANDADDNQIGEGQWTTRDGLASARSTCADLARRFYDGYIDHAGNSTGKRPNDQ